MHDRSDIKMKATSSWIITCEEENINDIKGVCRDGYAVYDTDECVLAVAKEKKHTSVELDFGNGVSEKKSRKRLKRDSFLVSDNNSVNGLAEAEGEVDSPFEVVSENGMSKKRSRKRQKKDLGLVYHDYSVNEFTEGDIDSPFEVVSEYGASKKKSRKKMKMDLWSVSDNYLVNNFEVSDGPEDYPTKREAVNGKRKRCDSGSSSNSGLDLDVSNIKESDVCDVEEPLYVKESNFITSPVGASLKGEEVTSDPEGVVKSNVPTVKSTGFKSGQLYKIENSDKYILHMPHPGMFSFQGKLKITLLAGRIEVFGLILNQSNYQKTLELYSPRRCMNLTVKTKLPPSKAGPCDMDALSRNGIKLCESDMEKLSEILKPEDAVLLAEKLTTPQSRAMSSYCGDLDMFFEKQIAGVGSTTEKDLDCILEKCDRKQFTVGSNWKKVKTKRCTVVCGGKGVGKSTLFKYFVNRRLSATHSVLCLDLDPGQTEFTAPGCVSGVVVDKPLLGPNFTHIIHPEKMVYIGKVNVGLDPTKYMESVKYVIDRCREDPNLSNLPWFVNTMGFNKGMGFDIMVNILRLLKPDIVIQINSTDPARNYPILLQPEAVESCSVVEYVPIEAGRLTYQFYSLKSCARLKGIGFQRFVPFQGSGFAPAELRELMIISYFADFVRFPYFSVNAEVPFWIPMSKVYLVGSPGMKPADVLKAYNGSLVGLTRVDEESCEDVLAVENADGGYFKIAVKPEVIPCFGLGIVRGVDCREKKIYMVTPLPRSKLQEVNCLALGDISLPDRIFLNQRWVDEPKAYVDLPGSRSVKCSKRKFRFDMRMKMAKSVRG